MNSLSNLQPTTAIGTPILSQQQRLPNDNHDNSNFPTNVEALAKRVGELAVAFFHTVIAPACRYLASLLFGMGKELAVAVGLTNPQFSPLPEYMKQLADKVDDKAMKEYQVLNPRDRNLDTLRKKLVFIQALEESSSSPELVRDLGLSENDQRVCKAVAQISEKVKELKGFCPRTNQLLSVLLFLDGKKTSLAQIKTGQGKTLIAAMTAIARKKIYNEKVCILTTTEPLAISGVSEMRALYEACGLRVDCFDGRKFVGDAIASSADVDVIYSTPFGLECDKVAKKKNGSQKLDIWDSPNETLQKLLRSFQRSANQDCKQFIAPSTRLLEQYQELPSASNEGEIKDHIQYLKVKYPGLQELHKGLCFVVDECDSVLYDHAGSRVQSTIMMPYAKDIKAVGKHIAKNVLEFYGSNPSPDRGQLQDLQRTLKTQVMDALRAGKPDPFLLEYVEGEFDQWVSDALKVMKPNDPEWQDGVNYLKAPSIANELKGMFVQLGYVYREILPSSKRYLGDVAGDGLNLHEQLQAIQDESSPVAGRVRQYTQSLIQYMPRLIVALTEENISQELRDPKYKPFKDAVVELYGRVQQLDQRRREFSDLTELQMKDVLVQNHIRYIEDGTAMIVENMKFNNLIHMFLEYKEYAGKTVTIPTTALDLQSQLDVIGDADCVVGFTGSLPSKEGHRQEYTHFKKLIEKVYTKGSQKAVMTAVPDFTKSLKTEEKAIESTSRASCQRSILKEISQKRDNQAILLVCKNPKEAMEMRDFLHSQQDRVYSPKALYIRKEDEGVINDSYKEGDIVITTALGARGTDWHVTAESGFHVLCSYKPHDARTQTQISGRSARSGQKGSYREVSIRSENRGQNEVKNINENVQQACYGDLFSSIYRILKATIGDKDRVRQQQLILWMSKTETQKEILAAIEQKLKNRTDPDSGLDAVFGKFCTKFDYDRDHRNTQYHEAAFGREITQWHGKTSAWFNSGRF
ncbi:MAG: hypothetical protein ACI9YB_001522 [Halioglobus sp.]